SIRRPCSRSVKSCCAALTIADATTAVACIESGAALAPPTRDSVMRGVFRRAGKGRTARHSPDTAAAPTLPGPPLPLDLRNNDRVRRAAPDPLSGLSE